MSSTLLVGLALAVGAPAPKGPPTAEAALVGEWVAVEIRVGGKDASPKDIANGPRFTFRADGRLAITDTPTAPSVEWYKVDAGANPPRVDLFPPEGANGPTLHGVFQLEGDTLTVALGLAESETDRPTKLESTEGSNTVLVVLRRAKKTYRAPAKQD